MELFLIVVAGVVAGGYILNKIVQTKPDALQRYEDEMDAKVRKAGYLGMEDLIRKAKDYMYTPNGNGDPLFVFNWELLHAVREALEELALDNDLIGVVQPDTVERKVNPWMNDWWRLPRDHSGFEVLLTRYAPHFVEDGDDTLSHNELTFSTLDGVKAAIGGIVIRLHEAGLSDTEIDATRNDAERKIRESYRARRKD